MRRVLVWVAPAGWEACIDAARALADAEITLLQVAEAPPGPPGGLLGRHRPPPHEAPPADDLLDDAAARLGRDSERRSPPGRPEHAVIEAAADFDLLVLSRTNTRIGPHSLGHATRFVVDHAPCPILLVWPGEPEGTRGPPRV
jgi:nucleotide-binding universal stress UspA family protein